MISEFRAAMELPPLISFHPWLYDDATGLPK